MTAHQKTALRVAAIFIGTWLLLALAIADFPPPLGFLGGGAIALLSLLSPGEPVRRLGPLL